MVVTLGRHSLGYFNPGARIGATHGTKHPVDPATGAPDATLYAMYHPAAALRQGSLKQTMLEDMCGLPDVLLEAHRIRVASGDYNIARVHLADAIERLAARRESLSDDRSPKDPYTHARPEHTETPDE